MDNDNSNLLRVALDAYIARQKAGGLEPLDSYFPYNFEEVDAVKWYGLGNAMVNDELRELTSCLNRWQESLKKWQAWNSVIARYGRNEAWELRREFLESLAHHCLLQPSAMRDTFTFVVTNSMHQVRLGSNQGYTDYLEGDPTIPGEQRKHLSRRKKEKRLSRLLSSFPDATQFMETLQKIDDETYRQQTSDFRNLVSHSIGPRLGIGITRAVVRTVAQPTELIRQPDGSFLLTPIPGKLAVSYDFGGTDPLDMDSALAANLNQYRLARACYVKYRRILSAGLAAMPPIQPAECDAPSHDGTSGD